MPLDTNIPLQARFAPINYEIPQPINTMMSMMKIKQAGQENALNEQKMAEYERTRIEEEGARNYLAKADLSTPEGRAGLLNFGKTGLAVDKTLTERDTAALTQQKTKFDIQKARKDFIAATQRDTSNNPSDANITAYKEDMQANPLFTPEEKARLAAGADRILAMPVSERQRFMSSQGAPASAIDLKPTVVGSSSSVYDPVSKTFIQAPAAPVTPAALPTSVAEYERAKTDPAFMKFLQDRAAATRAPRPDAAPRTQQVTLSDGSLGIVNMDTGVITPSTVGGAAVKGKPSPFAEKAAAQKVQMGKDINQALFELKTAAKDGGLIDKSTGSGAGRLYDVGAGFFGQAPEGAVAAGQLAPIADMVLKMVPRFEGPQSDKDTQSYKAAAGQLADSSLPTKIRKAAAKEIIRLMEARKAQFGSADMVTEGAPPAAAPAAAGALSPAEQAELDQLRKRFGGK
jgi:hypothetical protein